MTEKRFELRLCNNGTYYLWNNNELTDIAFDKFNKESANELVDLLNELHEENQVLQRHIKRSTFNKIRVEDVFNCAKYDKFYDNEEAIKSIDWIAKELGVDFE